MIVRNPRVRRVARDATRTASVLSAVMLAIASWMFATGAGVAPAGAVATNSGPLRVAAPAGGANAGGVLNSGGSATDFTLQLPDGAKCAGDSATDGYRVQSFMVPASVDPGALTFDAAGPTPNGTGASFRQPLYDTNGAPLVNHQTDIEVEGQEGGNISGTPAFDFAVFGDEGPTVVPAGSYTMGLACTKGPAGPDQLDRFWSVGLVFAHDSADEPSGIKWALAQVQATPVSVALTAEPADEAAAGAEVTLNASVTPLAAAGTITFKDGTTTLGSPVAHAGGKATYKTTALTSGARSLTATFTPTDPTAYAPGTSQVLTYKIKVGSGTTTTRPGGSTTSTTAPGTSASTTTTRGGSSSSSSSTTVAGELTVGGGAASTGGGTSAGGLLPASGSFASAATGLPTGTSFGAPVASLAFTGGSVSLAVWGVLLVVFGRMAVLLGRTPKVRPA